MVQKVSRELCKSWANFPKGGDDYLELLRTLSMNENHSRDFIPSEWRLASMRVEWKELFFT